MKNVLRRKARFSLRWVAAIASLIMPATLALADSDTPGKVVAGYVEKITLLENGLEIKAKLDTGAATSSILP